MSSLSGAFHIFASAGRCSLLLPPERENDWYAVEQRGVWASRARGCGTACYFGGLLAAMVFLTGIATVLDGEAAADPNQDHQFLELLDQQEIPAVKNVPSLIATAHDICGDLDSGMSTDAVIDLMTNNAFKADSTARQYSQARLTSTMKRFITAAVGAYCPYNQGKIASLMMANTGSGLTGSVARVAGYTHGQARGAVLVSLSSAVPTGQIDPNAPQIPGPPPPTAQILRPPKPIAAPPSPKKAPPPPQQLPVPTPPQQPPPPEQLPEPPANAPEPGGGTGGPGGGSGGGAGGAGGAGGGGGAAPTQPAPKPHRPPGIVRLAP